MRDNHGQMVDKAAPSTPVEISGWKDMPEVGETVKQFDNEVFQS